MRIHPTTLADAFAELLDMAAHGLFVTLLGRGAPRFIARASTQPANEMSHQYARMLETDGQVAGMICGFTGDQRRALQGVGEMLRRHAGWRMIRAGIIALPLVRVLSFMDRLAPDAY